MPLCTFIHVPLSLYVLSQSLHRHLEKLLYYLNSMPIFLYTHSAPPPLSTSCCSCIFNAECCWEVCVLGLFLRIFSNVFILCKFSSCLCCNPTLYSCSCWPCGMWSVLVELGGAVIATWTGRGSGDCVVFLFLFVYVVLLLVLGSCCPWSWRRLLSLSRCLTVIVVLMVAVTPTIRAL